MNTKIVLLGDPEQIDAPRLSKKMNGLVYVAEMLKGQKLTAVITMTEEECMRSELAKGSGETARLIFRVNAT